MTVSEALEQTGEVDRADVYQAGHRVAELVRTPDGVEFRNLDDWIERGDAVPLADKYRLRADQTFAALAAMCDATRLAGRELVRQLAFAYLTGNVDAHAKNFSVLRDLTGEWTTSPAHDLPSSHFYGDTTMALSIGGRGGGDFSAATFVALGARLGVPERAIGRVLFDLVARADGWLATLTELPFDRGQIAKLRGVIEHRRTRVSAVG